MFRSLSIDMPVSTISLSDEGPTVSRFVLGLWRLAEWDRSPSELRDYIEACLDLGVTTFDHADIYGDYTCEERFGRALQGHSALRERMQIVTKCGIKLPSENRPAHDVHHYDTSREHIVASAEQSLKALGTDRIDLFLIHRPDPLMDPEEVAEAFSTLHREGKVLHFGVSNFTPSQFELLADWLDVPLVTNQVQCSLLHQDPFLDGTFDQCQRQGIAPMAWSPLGGGRLFDGEGGPLATLRQTMKEIGQAHGHATIAQIAYAWLLRSPADIVPILGTGKIERVQRAVEAASIELSRAEWFRLWEAAGGEIP